MGFAHADHTLRFCAVSNEVRNKAKRTKPENWRKPEGFSPSKRHTHRVPFTYVVIDNLTSSSVTNLALSPSVHKRSRP